MTEDQAVEIEKHFRQGHDLVLRPQGRRARKNATSADIYCLNCKRVIYSIHFLDLSPETKKWFQEQAKQIHEQEGEVEVDPGARLSPGDEGSYVQAWVWVRYPVCEECDEPYDKTKEGSFGGLCPKCAAKTQPCGHCGETPKNEADYTSITDHGYCVDCHKKWQHGEVCPNCEGSGRETCPLCDGTGKAFPEES